LEKISKNVYAETKFEGSNNSFIVTRDGVVNDRHAAGAATNAVKWRENNGGIRENPLHY